MIDWKVATALLSPESASARALQIKYLPAQRPADV
jgi:hypothetical protein